MVIAVEAHRIAYMALPKAGCSSVKAALAQVDPAVTLPPEEEIDVMTWHAIYPTSRFRPHRWKRFGPDWWRFCVVRDPARRLMSCYTDRVVDKRDLHKSRKLRRGRVDLPQDPDPDFFFRNLRAYAEASSSIKHHCLGAWHFVGPRPLDYDRVYKTEEMGQLAADLSERVGQPVEMTRENRSSVTLALGDLAPATRDALRPFLAREYEHLSDFYENPLG